MRKGRLAGLHGLRQSDPQLQAMQAVAHRSKIGWCTLGMNDAAPRAHPVDGAGLDALHGAEAVTVQHRALEQISDSGQPDMRMRSHVGIHARLEVDGSEVIQEHEWADGAARQGGKQAAHAQSAPQVLVVAGKFEQHVSVSPQSDDQCTIRP